MATDQEQQLGASDDQAEIFLSDVSNESTDSLLEFHGILCAVRIFELNLKRMEQDDDVADRGRYGERYLENRVRSYTQLFDEVLEVYSRTRPSTTGPQRAEVSRLTKDLCLREIRGADPWTLAYLAGHRDMSITKRYVHPQTDTIREALGKARSGGSAKSEHVFGYSKETANSSLVDREPAIN